MLVSGGGCAYIRRGVCWYPKGCARITTHNIYYEKKEARQLNLGFLSISKVVLSVPKVGLIGDYLCQFVCIQS